MRITSKGQITIPQRIREKLGLLPDTEVDFVVDGNTVRLVKVETSNENSRGRKTVMRLRGRADISMSTDEIMDLTRKS